MFSTLKAVDGFKQRFGSFSPVLACEMCQCQAGVLDFYIAEPRGHGNEGGGGLLDIKNAQYCESLK